eukprot:g13611.t1
MFLFLVRLFASFAATASSGAQYVAYPRTVTSGRAVSNAHKQYRSPEGHRRIRWKHRLHWRVDFSSPDTSALFNTMGPSSSCSCHDGENRGFGSGSSLGAAGKESGLFLPAWNPKNSDRGGRSCAAQSSPSQHYCDASRTSSSWRRLPFNTQREDARVDVVLVPSPVGREPVQGQPPCGASVEDGGDGSWSHAMVSSVRWLGSDENGKETFALHIEHTDLARLGSCCSCRGDPVAEEEPQPTGAAPRQGDGLRPHRVHRTTAASCRRACGVRVDRNLQKAARINKMVELSTAEFDANKTLDARTVSFISKNCVVIHFHGNGHYVEQNFGNLLKLAVATGCDVFAPEYAHYVNNVEVPAEVGREGEVVVVSPAARQEASAKDAVCTGAADAVSGRAMLAAEFFERDVESLLTGAFATSTWLANMSASSCSPASSWLNVGEKLASFRRKQNELTRFLAQELLDGTTQSKFGVLGRRRQLVVAETLRKLMLVEDGKMYEAATLVSSQPRFLFLHTVDDQVVGVKSLLENLSQIIGSGTNAEIEDRAELVEVIAKHQHRRKVLDELRLSQTKANKGRAPASAPSAAARSGKEPALVLGMSSRGRDHPNQVQASARQDTQARGPARAARMSWSPDLGSEQQRAALGLEEPLYRKKFPHDKTGTRIVAGDKYSERRIAVARPVTAVLFPRGGHDQGGNLGVDAAYLAEIKEFVSAAGEDVVASGGEYML